MQLLTNEEINFLQQRLQNKVNPVTFDVGSFHGEWTINAANINQQIIAHCFEPSTVGFPILCAYLQHFNVAAIANNVAVSDKDGIINYWHIQNEQHSSGSSPYFRVSSDVWQGFKPVQTQVPCLSIDNYCLNNNIEYIDIMKIDTEGHEDSVLLGCDNLLKKNKIGAIQLEYGLCWQDANKKLKDTMIRLKQYGYSKFINIEKQQNIDIDIFEENYNYFNLGIIL